MQTFTIIMFKSSSALLVNTALISDFCINQKKLVNMILPEVIVLPFKYSFEKYVL